MFLRKACILLSALLLTGCDGTPEQQAALGAAAVVLTTGSSPEAQRGAAVAALPDVLKGRPRSRFANAERYMQGIADKIARANNLSSHRWEIYLLAERNANAATVGGGIIFANEGLVLQTPNEADIAIVLAHEMAHTTQDDVGQGKRTGALIGLGAVVAREALKRQGHSDQSIQATLTGLGLGAIAAQGSQSREARADRVGFEYYVKAGYRPTASPALFERLARLQGESSKAAAVFESHPQPSQRAQALHRLIGTTSRPNSGIVNTQAWAAIHSQIKSAHAPRR